MKRILKATSVPSQFFWTTPEKNSTLARRDRAHRRAKLFVEEQIECSTEDATDMCEEVSAHLLSFSH